METNETQEKKSKVAAKRSTYSAQHVKSETRKRIKALVAQLNRKDFGRRIHGDAVIALGLSLIRAEHLSKLQEASLSESDRLERDYRTYVAKHGPITKDAYLGMRLRGEIASSAEEKPTEESPVK